MPQRSAQLRLCRCIKQEGANKESGEGGEECADQRKLRKVCTSCRSAPTLSGLLPATADLFFIPLWFLVRQTCASAATGWLALIASGRVGSAPALRRLAPHRAATEGQHRVAAPSRQCQPFSFFSSFYFKCRELVLVARFNGKTGITKCVACECACVVCVCRTSVCFVHRMKGTCKLFISRIPSFSYLCPPFFLVPTLLLHFVDIVSNHPFRFGLIMLLFWDRRT